MTMFSELRSNIRLRLGVAFVLAIAVAYGLLEWRDQNSKRLADYRQLAAKLVRLENQQTQSQWPARALEAKTALTAADGRLWRQTSVGLAQAQFQDWLYALLRQADAKNISVKVSEGDVGFEPTKPAEALPAELQQLKRLRARVEFATDAPIMLALLAALNDAEHQVTVDVLNVKPLKSDMTLTVWYDIRPQVDPTTDRRPPGQQPQAASARK